MIETLVPSSVATAETRADLPDVALFPDEERCVAGAIERRRHEFATGRACARAAMAKLGVSPTALAKGERGEPLWPQGVVGSITHCRGYRASAAARAAEIASLGIDAEPDEPLPARVIERVAFGHEREWVADAPDHLASVCADRLLFSAKEAVYKAWYPLARRWLGFEDVEIALGVDHPSSASTSGELRARLLVAGPQVDGLVLRELRGRWCARDSLVAAAFVVPRTAGARPPTARSHR